MLAQETGIVVRTYLNGKLKAGHKGTYLSVLIDGDEHAVPLGASFVRLPPGRHEITVRWAYFRRATASVVVSADQQTQLRFDLANFLWQRPSLTVTDDAPADEPVVTVHESVAPS